MIKSCLWTVYYRIKFLNIVTKVGEENNKLCNIQITVTAPYLGYKAAAAYKRIGSYHNPWFPLGLPLYINYRAIAEATDFHYKFAKLLPNEKQIEKENTKPVHIEQ